MIALLILCIIGNYICCYFTTKIAEEEKDLKKRKERSNVFFIIALVLSIISSVLLIRIIDSNNNGRAVGSSTYYVNGKKVASSTYAATQNFMIGFMFCILLFGTGMSISANIIKKKNKEKVENKNKKPSIIALVFSILFSFFGFMLITTGISAMNNVIKSNSEDSPIIAVFLGTVFLILGIRGIVVFVKRKNN